MKSSSARSLVRILRGTRVAALGTLHEGEPSLAMVVYAFAEDFSAFYIVAGFGRSFNLLPEALVNLSGL